MATGQPPVAAPMWTIRSVSVRTRDGPERLDQAYRRLLSNSPFRLPADPDDSSSTPVPDRVLDPRR
jgi:hypothetical protein